MGQDVRQISLPNERVQFDVDAFDSWIRGEGVQFVHWRAMRCPVGLADMHDHTRRPHPDHEGCSNGFLYKRVGIISCAFSSNSQNQNQLDYGTIDGNSAQLTLPRTYDDHPDKKVYVAPFDRLYLHEEQILVPNWQLFEANVIGKDRLNFPPEHVEELIDNRGEEYRQGVDFELSRGNVVWTGSRRPGLDLETGRGRVCSTWYVYRPFYYVKSLGHEVRVTPSEDAFGNRQIQRMPQSITIQRENVFQNEDRDPDARNAQSLRQVQAPEDGSFGSR